MRVKVCGVTRAAEAAHVAAAGAAYLGLNFYPPSPRCLGLDDALEIALAIPPGVAKVGLVVDAADAELDAIVEAVPLDMIQLHGREDPERVAAVRARYGLPVIKALGLCGEDDLPAIDAHAPAADQLLIDAKPPAGAALPGGNGVAFDWRLVAGRRWPVPWLLAGGLTPQNVAEAIRLTGACQVDVSSGVESAPGRKDPARVEAFVAAASGARP